MVGVKNFLKNIFSIFVLLMLSLGVAFAEDVSIQSVGAGFFGTVNTVGTITDGSGAPVVDATVLFGALGSSAPVGSQWCATIGPATVTTTTNATGQYSINGFGFSTGNFSCILAIVINGTNYTTNNTNITLPVSDFNDGSETYVVDRIIYKHAELSVAITTNLSTDPYSDTNQVYDVTLTITNSGDIDAQSVASTLSAVQSTVLTPSMPIVTINGRSTITQTYTVRSPGIIVTDTLTADVTGIDADNSAALHTTATKTINIIAFAPVITITSPAGGSVMGPSAFFNATTDENAICQYKLESGIYVDMNTTGTTDHSQLLVNLSNGTNTAYINCTDMYGNWTEANVTWRVDNTIPSLIINTPVTGWYGGWLMFNITASDDFGVARVECYSNNLTHIGNYWLLNISTVSLAEGTPYNFTCTAIDNVGNSASQNVTDVLIDHTGPTVTITTPSNMTTLYMSHGFNVVAAIADTGSGVTDGSNCPVYISNNLAGQLTYNSTTGNCIGIVTLPRYTTPRILNLVVVAYDSVRNPGNNSISNSIYINATNAPTGGGGGGGGGGIAPITGTPEELLISVDAEPNSVDMISNESAEITVTIENIGKYTLQSLYLSVSGLDADEWTAEPDGRINIGPSNKTIIIVTITPKAHNDGDYTVKFTIGNARAEKSDTVDLSITNIEQLNAAGKARASCDNARALITSLSATGVNTAGLQTNLTIAEDAINDGDFITALGICDSISVRAGAGAGGITGLFIGVGSFVAGNWLWMLITAGLGLGAFIGRRQILKGFGKLGGGAVSLLKNKPKFPTLFSRKKTDLNTGEKKDDNNPEFEIGY